MTNWHIDPPWSNEATFLTHSLLYFDYRDSQLFNNQRIVITSKAILPHLLIMIATCFVNNWINDCAIIVLNLVIFTWHLYHSRYWFVGMWKVVVVEYRIHENCSNRMVTICHLLCWFIFSMCIRPCDEECTLLDDLFFRIMVWGRNSLCLLCALPLKEKAQYSNRSVFDKKHGNEMITIWWNKLTNCLEWIPSGDCLVVQDACQNDDCVFQKI